MSLHPLAGQPAPHSFLVNIPRLVSSYYAIKPDPHNPAQQVAFGTSGHRGTSLAGTFNEAHILAIAQAVAEYRAGQGITGPLFMGMDTHALSEAAWITAVEVLTANGVEVWVEEGRGYTPTPLVSHAILEYNRHRSGGLADGIVITPSHNPPRTAASNTTPERRPRRYRRDPGDPGTGQPDFAGRPGRGKTLAPQPGPGGGAGLRFCHALCAPAGKHCGYRLHQGRGCPDWGRPAGRFLATGLAAHRRGAWPRADGGERTDRPQLCLHDPG